MALLSEWMQKCGKNVLDNAGIVREACFRQLRIDYPVCRLSARTYINLCVSYSSNLIVVPHRNADVVDIMHRLEKVQTPSAKAPIGRARRIAIRQCPLDIVEHELMPSMVVAGRQQVGCSPRDQPATERGTPNRGIV